MQLVLFGLLGQAYPYFHSASKAAPTTIMTTPASPVNSVGVIIPVTGTPELVAGIATRVLGDGLSDAEGEETKAGSTPATPEVTEKLRTIFWAFPVAPTYDTVIVCFPFFKSITGDQVQVPSAAMLVVSLMAFCPVSAIERVSPEGPVPRNSGLRVASVSPSLAGLSSTTSAVVTAFTPAPESGSTLKIPGVVGVDALGLLLVAG